ncbi:FAD-binding oxidoreductase [Actinopolyspora erythraea]|uniref:FAD-binding oxidoreductase n=1 Tax=Actinopolyspora erythraea TaxID=414996 RepID=A0A099D9V2_9ACTN|nr:FAD-binding oxidoreductase [Actinopolyspora erythraea]ASU80113.1 FAD-binding oxidoreductase [Actinopolyspora erythraea]KGI82517.1 FAD-binding protein [Actinopolyspora erythraea]
MTDTTRNAEPKLDALRRHVRGRAITPGGSGYDGSTTGFQLLDPHRPDVVVEAADESDVRAAVEFATHSGTRLAVQATGHGRGAALRGGVLLDTHRMSGVRVDPKARTAWVEAGADWQRVIEAAAPHGLAPPSGSFPGVGAVSYALGGGVGLLARRHGFVADHVRRLDVVTPDGTHRRVSAYEEPELFWGVRGGGGNFGVVTGMEIALLPVRRIYGGGLFFDLARVPEVLRAWRDWTGTVPEEMTSAATMLPYPDVAGVPEALRGRHVAQLQFSYLGSAEEGERLVEPLRGLGAPLRDTLRELPYSESGTVFDEPDQPHGYRGGNLLLAGASDRELSELVERTGPSAPVMCVTGIRHLGGALARQPEVPNAVGHRAAGFSLGVLSPVEPGAGEDETRKRHDEVLALFEGRAHGHSLNFSYGSLEPERVSTAFDPATYRRLAELKARYDPDAMLHTNHPIPPLGNGR